jgi:hypothetical protein
MKRPDLDQGLDAYLNALRDELGPRSSGGPAADLIDECRDHILSHAEYSIAQGVSPRSAIGSALHDFGALETVTMVMRGECRRQYLRRLSTVLLISGGVLGGCWRGVIAFGPVAPWRDGAQPAAIAAFDTIGDATATVAVALAAASLLLLLLPERLGPLRAPTLLRPVGQRWAGWCCLVSAVLGATAVLQVAAYLISRGAMSPASVAWPAVSGAGLLTLAGVAAVVRPLRTVVALS